MIIVVPAMPGATMIVVTIIVIPAMPGATMIVATIIVIPAMPGATMIVATIIVIPATPGATVVVTTIIVIPAAPGTVPVVSVLRKGDGSFYRDKPETGIQADTPRRECHHARERHCCRRRPEQVGLPHDRSPVLADASMRSTKAGIRP
ncbi:hypothetical protein [Rhodobacter sp. CZR27]|uniref:hypothetical protein n=1 Tax=Rhodobacter sp. CZR27 TaxID=2033869 RepID=UPI0018E0BA78|nr:hypothetical protein [Rhodobacter sp. CZR27]